MAGAATPSIDALFGAAVAKLHLVDDTWPALAYLARTTAPERPSRSDEATQEAVQALDRLARAVHQAGLISPNEDLDEISTRSLRHLLIPLLQARAHAQTQGESRERYEALDEAKRMLEVFFESMERLRILRADRGVALEGRGESREEKIARFKKEKECEQRIKAMRDDNEDDEREVALMVLESGVRRGVEMMGGLTREMEILKFAVQRMERGDLDEVMQREKERVAREKEKVRAEGRGAFRIVSERERAREGVFRASHNLPTYTVEEWGEIEMERMARAEREKKEKIVQVKTEEEEEEDERREASRFDDWKDEHNKGSGNTIR